VVITGLDRDFVGAMIFPDVAACHTLCPQLPAGATKEILANAAVRARFQSLLNSLAAESTGSSRRVARAILLEESPSLDAGEVTDKGSFNQRAVLDRRAALVEQIYAKEPHASVIEPRKD
jgi:feruloyl-CoA synthase